MYETYLKKNWVILQLNIVEQYCLIRKTFFNIRWKGFWKLFKIILIFAVHFVPGTVPLIGQQGALLPLKKTWEFRPRVQNFLKS